MKKIEDILLRFDDLQDLPISEETLGSFLDNTISEEERIRLEGYMDINPDFKDFVGSIDTFGNDNVFCSVSNNDEFLNDIQSEAMDIVQIEIPELTGIIDNSSIEDSPNELSNKHKTHREHFGLLDDQPQILTGQHDVTNHEDFFNETDSFEVPPLHQDMEEDNYDNIFDNE